MIGIWGPPRAGKSSLLARISNLTATRLWKNKIMTLDLELFFSAKDRFQVYDQILCMVRDTNSCAVIGMADYNPEVYAKRYRDTTDLMILFVPPLDEYIDTIKQKRAKEGRSEEEDDYYHRDELSIKIYHDLIGAFTAINLYKKALIIDNAEDVLYRVANYYQTDLSKSLLLPK